MTKWRKIWRRKFLNRHSRANLPPSLLASHNIELASTLLPQSDVPSLHVVPERNHYQSIRAQSSQNDLLWTCWWPCQDKYGDLTLFQNLALAFVIGVTFMGVRHQMGCWTLVLPTLAFFYGIHVFKRFLIFENSGKLRLSEIGSSDFI